MSLDSFSNNELISSWLQIKKLLAKFQLLKRYYFSVKASDTRTPGLIAKENLMMMTTAYLLRTSSWTK